MNRITQFSPCRKYRYTLWRDWFEDVHDHGAYAAPLPAYVQFIGLNPSTADETKDDPTIRRCIQFAKDWGYSALCMTNLFAWRDTLPKNMKKAVEPIGEHNDKWLLDMAKDAAMVVAAWGTNGTHLYRAAKVKIMFREAGIKLHYLRMTKDGHPEHPLYIPAETVPQLLK